jgi:hypothetical protein
VRDGRHPDDGPQVNDSVLRGKKTLVRFTDVTCPPDSATKIRPAGVSLERPTHWKDELQRGQLRAGILLASHFRVRVRKISALLV